MSAPERVRPRPTRRGRRSSAPTGVTVDDLDAAVERTARRREQLLRQPETPARAEQVAELFDTEAALWGQLYELTSLRLVWRAALAAEALARRDAAAWRRRTCSAPGRA